MVFLVGDIWSKSAIFTLPEAQQGGDFKQTLIASNEQWREVFWILPSFNTGVAWSLFDQYPSMVAWMTVILIPVLVVFFWKWFRGGSRIEVIAFGSVLGGAIGNAWDRLWALKADSGIFGVRDFIHVDLGFPPFDPWPTFNVADIGITCGFVVLLIISFFKKPPATETASEEVGQDVTGSGDTKPSQDFTSVPKA